jgi:hypothetical protein
MSPNQSRKTHKLTDLVGGVKKRGVYSITQRGTRGVPSAAQIRLLQRKQRETRRNTKRATMQTPAGKKQKGVHTAFTPRLPARSMHEFLKNIYSRFARMQESMWRKRTDAQILSATRAALAAVEEYADYFSKKKVKDIEVAVFERKSFTEAKLEDLERYYRTLAVRDMAENYVETPGQFQELMTAGINDSLFEELGYIIPAVVLEYFKNLYNGRVYNMLEPKEKKFMKESFDFFLARTPRTVYELREGAPLPEWYLADLYKAMAAKIDANSMLLQKKQRETRRNAARSSY